MVVNNADWWWCVQKKGVELVELDWWSKYYASKGETDKCMNYVEQGYDVMQVRRHSSVEQVGVQLPTPADNVALPAFAATRRAAARLMAAGRRPCSNRSSASEVTTLWRYTNLFIVIIIIIIIGSMKTLHRWSLVLFVIRDLHGYYYYYLKILYPR